MLSPCTTCLNIMSSDRLLADSLTTNCNVFCCSLPYYVTSSVAQSALSVRTSVTSTRLNILINHVTQATMVSNGSTYSHSDTSNVIRFVGSSIWCINMYIYKGILRCVLQLRVIHLPRLILNCLVTLVSLHLWSLILLNTMQLIDNRQKKDQANTLNTLLHFVYFLICTNVYDI